MVLSTLNRWYDHVTNNVMESNTKALARTTEVVSKGLKRRETSHWVISFFWAKLEDITDVNF